MRPTLVAGDLLISYAPTGLKHYLVSLPLDRAFLGSVDLSGLRHLAEQKTLDVVEKEGLRVRV